jgi:hypothetical protein
VANFGALSVRNSIIEGECNAHIINESPLASHGHNIESPGNTCSFEQVSDQFDVSTENLKLRPLANNGGQTATQALLPGSVAINVVASELCVDANDVPLLTDQRGVERPQGAACDVGAFELVP